MVAQPRLSSLCNGNDLDIGRRSSDGRASKWSAHSAARQHEQERAPEPRRTLTEIVYDVISRFATADNPTLDAIEITKHVGTLYPVYKEERDESLLEQSIKRCLPPNPRANEAFYMVTDSDDCQKWGIRPGRFSDRKTGRVLIGFQSYEMRPDSSGKKNVKATRTLEKRGHISRQSRSASRTSQGRARVYVDDDMADNENVIRSDALPKNAKEPGVPGEKRQSFGTSPRKRQRNFDKELQHPDDYSDIELDSTSLMVELTPTTVTSKEKKGGRDSSSDEDFVILQENDTSLFYDTEVESANGQASIQPRGTESTTMKTHPESNTSSASLNRIHQEKTPKNEEKSEGKTKSNTQLSDTDDGSDQGASMHDFTFNIDLILLRPSA